MSKNVYASISTSLYNKIIQEKRRLQLKEKNKIKSRRRRITLAIASNSLARQLK